MSLRLTIICEVGDESELVNIDWQGSPPPADMFVALERFYRENPAEAFEAALTFKTFKTVEARLERIG